MKVSIQIEGMEPIKRVLEGFSQRRLNAAVATGLTRTAKSLAGHWNENIKGAIDRPNQRTQSASMFKGASAQKLEASVFLKNTLDGVNPADYLRPQEFGGGRGIKLFEQALVNSGAMPAGYVTVPGRAAQRDAYGNVRRSLIIAVIAQLGSEYSPGYQRVISKSLGKRMATQAKRGKRYIVVKPGQERVMGGIDAGVYELQPGGKRIAMFLFKRSVSYTKRLDLIGSGMTVGATILQAEVAKSIDEHITKLAGSSS